MDQLLKGKIWIGPQISNIQKDFEIEFMDYYQIPIIIGLTGPTKSGKTIIARRMIAEHGFHYFNLSTFLKEHSRNLGQNNRSWDNLRTIAEALRTEYKNDVLARWAIKRIKPYLVSGSKIVLDGVLHPEEVSFLRNFSNFFLVGVQASLTIRFRQAKRWYPDEFSSIEIIKIRDEYEHVDSKHKRHNFNAPDISDCMKQTDYNITITKDFNDKSVYRQADQIIEDVLTKSINS